MSNLNKRSTSGAASFIRSSQVPDARTALGGAGYLPSDAKSELYDLGVNLFAGDEDNFHESGASRDARFKRLVAMVAIEDPAWIHGFLGWLRKDGYIRTASIMGAVEAVHARLSDPRSVDLDKVSELGWNRKITDVACQRADEPAELLAYWINTYGKPVPQPVKRGLSDAAARLYNQYTYMKWDKDGAAVRMADVIELTHAKPRVFLAEDVLDDNGEVIFKASKFDQSKLFKLAIADRHGNATWETYQGLDMINANKNLRKAFPENPNVLLNVNLLKAAGFTWEDALSLAGNKVDKAKLWEALIFSKSIPFFAMIRNLRNMEQAGISREAMKFVCDYISNPEVVAKSGVFPFKLYAAHRYTSSVHWSSAIEDAMTYSTQNVPELRGRTLILVDASGSMFGTKLSNKSELERVEAACVFGAALAVRNPAADVYTFSNDVRKVTIHKGASMLKAIDLLMGTARGQQGGTDTVGAVRSTFSGHDRVIIITDEQSAHSYYGNVNDQVTGNTYLYSFDLAGHRVSDIPSGKNRRHQLAGLTDKSFQVIPLLERGRNAKWPWES